MLRKKEIADQAPAAVRHEIKIDLQGLIRLLAKNLYSQADVFVRELIQNAHDAPAAAGRPEEARPRR